MSSLNNKNILLGVTGGIAAYKSAEITRKLKSYGADVRVVMTKSAKEFITKLTMQALSGNPVSTDLLDTDSEATMGHIELARWADAILIAPCTADTIARLMVGRGDDLLSAVCLAFDGKITLAPAMNQAMWRDSRTQENLKKLLKKGMLLCGPESGDQACGDVGLGRMLEPKSIVKEIALLFAPGSMSNKRILITAGPTHEPIDPARFISNRSSGKMGYSLAEAAIEAGAEVTLISGPVNLDKPKKAHVVKVETAEEMYRKVMHYASKVDIYIGTAAVADYSPKTVRNKKIKKNPNTKDPNTKALTLKMKENKDILLEVSKLDNGPYVIGFAAETEDLIKNARKKLKDKSLDLIIANDISVPGIGFDSDFNEVLVVSMKEEVLIPKCEKRKLSRKIIEHVASEL